MLEIYALLFVDTLVSNLAFNINTEIVINSMLVFDYNKIIIIIVTAMAYFVSILINYLFGKITYNILAPISADKEKSQDRMGLIKNSRFLPLILLISGIPMMGKFVILFAGFCKVRLLMVISFAMIAKLTYYTLLIYEFI
ncbi:MAG: DedA family protein [Rickettsiaceae bacterium]|nr:DedA family protein [Rickettsiaceae bacterium]